MIKMAPNEYFYILKNTLSSPFKRTPEQKTQPDNKNNIPRTPATTEIISICN